jgi:hypothetical protein
VDQSKADQDVGFSLDVLGRFYAACAASTARALEFINCDPDEVDTLNLAASLVPEYPDELRAIGHLLVGHPVSEDEARVIVYDAAHACVIKALRPDAG